MHALCLLKPCLLGLPTDPSHVAAGGSPPIPSPTGITYRPVVLLGLPTQLACRPPAGGLVNRIVSTVVKPKTIVKMTCNPAVYCRVLNS